MPPAAATAVSHLAAAQRGVLTTAQAREEGVSRVQLARLAEKGLLERLGQGVYAVASAASDEHVELRAAWLSLEPSLRAEQRLSDLSTGVVSHASAAGLHRLGDLLDDEHDITFPGRRQTRREGVRIHRAALAEADVTLVEGLPVTTPARTIADLLRAGTDHALVADMVAEGLGRGVIEEVDLVARLDPLARRHGESNGRSLLDALLDVVGMSPAALAAALAPTDVGRRIAADVLGRLNDELARSVGSMSDLNRLGVTLPSPDLGDSLRPSLEPMLRPLLREALRPATTAASARLLASVDWSRLQEPSLAAMRRVVEASTAVSLAPYEADGASDAATPERERKPGTAPPQEETT